MYLVPIATEIVTVVVFVFWKLVATAHSLLQQEVRIFCQLAWKVASLFVIEIQVIDCSIHFFSEDILIQYRLLFLFLIQFDHVTRGDASQANCFGGVEDVVHQVEIVDVLFIAFVTLQIVVMNYCSEVPVVAFIEFIEVLGIGLLHIHLFVNIFHLNFGVLFETKLLHLEIGLLVVIDFVFAPEPDLDMR
jgi:hypothetical protein